MNADERGYSHGRNNVKPCGETAAAKDIDKDGRIYLVGKDVMKENIGRSTDFGDMVMMRMIFEVNRKPTPRITAL